MKITVPSVSLFAIGLFCLSGLVHAQEALKTDPAGNPLTSLNLGGGNVTGTLAPARLPASVSPPIVQTITAVEGDVMLTSGTNVAVLAAPLTGVLNVTLPAANSYAAGRALVIVDPGGYSGFSRPVNAVPARADTLNADPEPLQILAGAGAASLQPDGATGWSVGQSYVRAASLNGLTLAGPASTGDDTLLSLLNGDGTEAFYVRGDGTAGTQNLTLGGALTSDAGSLVSDGDGDLGTINVNAEESVSTHRLTLYTVAGSEINTHPAGQVRVYYRTDGFLHARTSDGADHTILWTTP